MKDYELVDLMNGKTYETKSFINLDTAVEYFKKADYRGQYEVRHYNPVTDRIDECKRRI